MRDRYGDSSHHERTLYRQHIPDNKDTQTSKVADNIITLHSNIGANINIIFRVKGKNDPLTPSSSTPISYILRALDDIFLVSNSDSYISDRYNYKC